MRRDQKTFLILFGVVDCVLAMGALWIALKLPAQASPPPTLVYTSTPLAPAAVYVSTETSASSPTPSPIAAAELGNASVITYTAANGDTLWGLSVLFKVPLSTLMAANPNASSDHLEVGQVVMIPVAPTGTPIPPTATLAAAETASPEAPAAGQPSETTTLTPQPTATVVARVVANGQGLRFRRAPGTAGEIFAYLNALTPLLPIGRTADNAWLEVIAPEGQGWVMAIWVEVFINPETIPVREVAVVMASETPPPPPTATGLPWSSATPRPSATVAPPLAPGQPTSPPPTYAPPTSPGQPTSPPPTYAPPSTQAPPGFPPPGSYPLISGVTDNARQIFLRGQGLGNRANVFSKIGDSITANEVFLTPIGWGMYDLRQYTYLASVVAYYLQTPARTANSFANTSLAAKGGWAAFQVLNPGAVFEPSICGSRERPIECEYRVVKPSVALILIGTNDVRYTSTSEYEAEMRLIIQISLDRGVIPVLSTLPPLHRDWATGRVEMLNGIIVALAREYDIPLWDYWSALQGLPNDGLSTDGIHPSFYTGHAADFSPDYLQSGYAMRNLLALQALDAVWQAAMH